MLLTLWIILTLCSCSSAFSSALLLSGISQAGQRVTQVTQVGLRSTRVLHHFHYCLFHLLPTHLPECKQECMLQFGSCNSWSSSHTLSPVCYHHHPSQVMGSSPVTMQVQLGHRCSPQKSLYPSLGSEDPKLLSPSGVEVVFGLPVPGLSPLLSPIQSPEMIGDLDHLVAFHGPSFSCSLADADSQWYHGVVACLSLLWPCPCFPCPGPPVTLMGSRLRGREWCAKVRGGRHKHTREGADARQTQYTV